MPRIRKLISMPLGEFLFSFFLMPALLYALSRYAGVNKEIGADAQLYLSIADNFLSTGHFIQNVRPAGSYVVPFGLPLILTVLRFLRFDYSMIVVFQYALYGASCCFLSRTESALFGRGYIAPLVMTGALYRTKIFFGEIYVEGYYLFFLCALLWLITNTSFSEPKRIAAMNAAGFLAFVIRAVLGTVYAAVLIYTVIAARKKKIGVRTVVLSFLLPCLILTANAALNRRETGYWIWLENYSGKDLYYANNPSTKTGYFSTSVYEEFVDEEFFKIWDDPNMDYTEKNEELASRAKQWVKDNPGQFLKNAVVRFYNIFISYWRYLLVICFLCGLARIALVPVGRRAAAVCLMLNLLLAFLTACGTIMGRYSLPVWPLASVHAAAGFHLCLRRIIRRSKDLPSGTVPGA